MCKCFVNIFVKAESQQEGVFWKGWCSSHYAGLQWCSENSACFSGIHCYPDSFHMIYQVFSFFKSSSKSLLCKEWAEHTFLKKWAGLIFLAWNAHTRSISDFKFSFPFLGSSEGLCIAGKRSTSKPHLQPLYFQIFKLLLAATYNVPVILGDLHILSVIVTSILQSRAHSW